MGRYLSKMNLIRFPKACPYFLYIINDACSRNAYKIFGVIERGGIFKIAASQVQAILMPRTLGFPIDIMILIIAKYYLPDRVLDCKIAANKLIKPDMRSKNAASVSRTDPSTVK